MLMVTPAAKVTGIKWLFDMAMPQILRTCSLILLCQSVSCIWLESTTIALGSNLHHALGERRVGLVPMGESGGRERAE